MSSRNRYTIELEDLPGKPNQPDAAARLQRLLKFASRGLGFRCLEVRDVEPSDAGEMHLSPVEHLRDK